MELEKLAYTFYALMLWSLVELDSRHVFTVPSLITPISKQIFYL